MFIWDLLTVFTDVLELIFSFLTGVLSLLATLATLNERLLLFVIDCFQTATDEVYNLVEFLEKLFTCGLSREDFDHYGFGTLNNTCDRILYWFLGVFEQFLAPFPISVSVAILFAVLSVIHRRKWIRCLRYLLPNRQQNRWTRRFIVWDTNDDHEDDWNANENLDLDDDDHILRAETLNGERDSSSGDVAAYSAATEVTADSHAERYRESSRKSNVDNIRCSLGSQEDRLLCVICQDKSKSVLVLPCRHLCMCEACAKVVSSDAELPKTCPLCRTAISRLINVYV